MKAKDIRTLESLLKELYPNYNKGVQGNAGMVSPSIANTKPVSPTMSKGAQAAKPVSNVKVKTAPAGNLQRGDKIINPNTGQQDAEVVSPVGAQPITKKPVVKTPDGKLVAIDPNANVVAQEGSVSSMLTKPLSKVVKSKRLIRKLKLREQGTEQIFEINFNSKEIAQQALDLPIKCGFEAETSWDNVSGGGDDDDDWLYEYNWYDIEDFVRDQEGSRAADRIQGSYDEWILDKAMEDYESDVMAEMVADREEDEYYLNKYIEDELSESDIEDYKERILDDLPEEDQEEYADWDFMNWGRQYVEEELLDQYKEWLEEDIRDNGESLDEAITRARDDLDIDQWANDEYGSWYSCLSDHDIYLSNPNDDGGRGVEEVAEYVELWAGDNSTTTDVRAGEYHSGKSVDNTYWRVETDSSIQTDGTGAEIISPVYRTPRAMLEEMKSLFSWLEGQDADTNRSTGLHVTMSLDSEDTEEINPVKLAVLLGDKYLLSTFGRESNSYARSQYKNLEKLGNKLKSNPDAKTIKQIENILSSGISRDKFSSINFKDQKDSNTGNQLIEFRIGGGSDYHKDFPKIVKAVIRYAATMQAAYSDKLYNADYAKALYRLINNVNKISADAEQRGKNRIDPGVEAPAVDVLKDYFSEDNYIESMRLLSSAYNQLSQYQQLKSKQTEDVETDGPDSDRMEKALLGAQQNFAGAVAQAGYDFSQGHNRSTPNAKSIGVLRSALKDFELDYDKLSSLINTHRDHISTGDSRSNLTHKQILGRIKNGVDKLFKKSVVQEPEYLSANQVEKLINGMWNAVNSGELQDGIQARQFIKLFADAANTTTDYVASWLDQTHTEPRKSTGREYKEFHKSVTQGGYGEKAIFTPGSPIDAKKLKAFTDHLKQYPEWEHPVSRNHNPNISYDDSYLDNALNKMMIKMRARWEHLEDIRQDNPGLYIDSMREIAKLVTNLVGAVKTVDHMMGDKHKDLLGTAHAQHRDGAQYFGMGERTAEQLMGMVKSIERPGERMVWDEPVAHQLRDSIQNYLRTAYGRYYDMKSRESAGFYRLGPVPEIIKQRTDAIKEFLTGFDKIAQSHGFDSQSSEIANKKQLDKQQAKFQSKHGPRTFKVDAFDFGGYVFAEKGFAQGVEHMAPEGVARALQQTSNIHRTDFGELLIMPTIHYFTALEAWKMLSNPAQFKDTWRWEKAQAVLRKFESVYKIDFQDLSDKYVDINDDNLRVKTKLNQQNVVFTNKLGDGREGVGKFGPLIPRADLDGPDGEPFEPSSAVTWRINRDEEKAGIPSHLRGLNDFGKARVNFTMFDYMMNNGIDQYVKNNEKQELVAFLNNETQVNPATKEKMLTIMINNVDDDQRAPMGISQALVKAKSQSENMNTFDKFDNLPLAEQLRIIAKVDKKKIDEAWSKKYKDSINCSNPKGFSQKAHCDGKKKKVSERPLTKGEERDKEKYVKGMKKNKGDFEKRYGKDAKAVMYATATKMAKEDVAEGAVPDNRAVTILNKLFAESMPANDLRKQMDAYIAIPDPSMIRDFRMHRSAYGENACLRGILRRYVETQLDPKLKSKVNLNEWYSNTFNKLLTESSRGIIGTVLDNQAGRGDSFVNNEGIQYTPVNAYKFPIENEQAKYDAIDENGDPVNPDTEFTDELMMLLNLPTSSVTWCGGLKASTGYAVLIVELDSSDNNKIFVGKYFRSKDASGHLFWQVSKFLQDVNAKGIKLALKRGENRTGTHGAISLFPSNLGITGNLLPIDKVPAVIQESMKKVNVLDDSQQAVINSLVAGLYTGQPSQISPEYAANYEVQLGETVTPIALNKGIHVSGSYTEAEQTLLSVLEPGLTWRGMTSVEYPSDIAEKLIDSYMYSPKGTKVGVSSKDKKGGAPASITGIIETLENRYDVILDRVPDFGERYKKYLDYLKVIKSSTGLQQPLNLAVHLGIITPDVAMQAQDVIYKRPGDSEALKKIDGGKFYRMTIGYAGYTPKPHPLYQVGYHALASLARIVQNIMNEDVVDISRFFSTILESSNMVQVKTGFKSSGDQGAFDSFYVIYPPVFKGTILFDCGSYYYATKKPTGGFTFKFKGSRG